MAEFYVYINFLVLNNYNVLTVLLLLVFQIL